MPDWVELAKLFGPMGVILWLVVRMTSHTIPRIVKSFEDAIALQRADLKQMMVEQRGDFTTMIDQQQVFHGKQIDKLVESIHALGKEMRKARPITRSAPKSVEP